MQSKEIAGRAFIIFLFFCLLGLVIIGKVIYIQVSPGERTLELSRTLTQVVREIPSTRGSILSPDGKPWVMSVPIYEIYWDSQARFDQKEFMKKLDSLAIGFASVSPSKSPAEFKALLLKTLKQKKRYQLIAKNIDHHKLSAIKNFAFIRGKKQSESGFIFHMTHVREKPMGELASRTLGIMRDNNAVGIEYAFNEQLAGVNGKQVCKIVPGGFLLPADDQAIVEPEPGCDVVSTIDRHLQDVAHSALLHQLTVSNAEWGCAILMEVETGYVRAIANLSRTSDGSGYAEVLNHAIRTRVEPGSTFKLATLMACMDEGLVDPEDTVDTGNGMFEFCGKPMKDSNYKTGGHGKITVEEVFERSSNIGTALAVKKAFGAEPQRLLDKLNSFGLGESLGIQLEGENKPQLFTSVKDKLWNGCSLTSMAIGYGTTQTPLQTLAFYNAIANNGRMVRPIFVQEIRQKGKTIREFRPEVIREGFCSEATIEKVRHMMEGVMQKGGTAGDVFKNEPYTVAGKTGTAWINEAGGYVHEHYRASFVGYFPADKPKYSCIVVIHDPRGSYYGSAVAAPVFKSLAGKICATQLEFHQNNLLALSTDSVKVKIPVSKNGSASEIKKVLKALALPADVAAASPWVKTTTEEDAVKLTDIETVPGTVPNVAGMGLQDALYLLESAGLRVRTAGTGRVVRQSMPPGTRIGTDKNIFIELI